MSAENEAKVRKKRGPKPRYGEATQDMHIRLTVELLRRIDETAEEGRPAYIEQVMRQHFGMPPAEKQQR